MILAVLYIIGAILVLFAGTHYARTTPSIVPSYYLWYIGLCICIIVAGIRLFPHAFDR